MFGCKWQKSQRKMRMKGTMHQSTPTNLGSRVWQINGLGDVGGGRGVVGGGGGDLASLIYSCWLAGKCFRHFCLTEWSDPLSYRVWKLSVTTHILKSNISFHHTSVDDTRRAGHSTGTQTGSYPKEISACCWEWESKHAHGTDMHVPVDSPAYGGDVMIASCSHKLMSWYIPSCSHKLMSWYIPSCSHKLTLW